MINEYYAKQFCKDDISKIENYELAIADKTQTWHCHHRRETIYSKSDLIEIGEYYNRPAIELIFLTPKEHLHLHRKGKAHSTETRRKISESHKGLNTWMKGKHLAKETRRKISEAMKGNKRALGNKLSDEHKRKISEARKLYWEKRRQLKTNSDK